MPRADPWDTPGGHGGREALEALGARPSPRGGARALYVRWHDAMAEICGQRVLQATIKPEEFNAWRRRRLDEGLTDDQLAQSFEIFVTAAIHGGVSVRHNDLWRTYVATWARWVSQTSVPVTEPLRGRRRDPGYQP